MKVQITNLARWQVRLALEDMRKKQDPEAKTFAQGLHALLADPKTLPSLPQPLAGMCEVPQREIVLGSYHLFFREVEDILWFIGLWPPLYTS